MIYLPTTRQNKYVSRWSKTGAAVLSDMVLIHNSSPVLLPTVLTGSRVLKLLIPVILTFFQVSNENEAAIGRGLTLLRHVLVKAPHNIIEIDEDGDYGIEHSLQLVQALVMCCLSSPDKETRNEVWTL